MLFFAGAIAFVVSLRFAWEHRAAHGWRRWLALTTPLGLLALTIAFAPRGHLLSKSIGAMAMPMGLAWLAALGLALTAWWHRRLGVAGLFAAIWLLVTLAGNEPLGELLDAHVEGEHARARPFDEGPFDAVIVLGGGTSDTPRGVPQLGQSGDRVILGARLYHRGATPLLVTSGSPIAGLSDHDSVAATTQIWTELGVPLDAIVQVQGARTTGEEAARHAELIRRRGWERVGVVTSARHMRRARANFEGRGVDIVPLTADVRTPPSIEWRGFYSLVPRGTAAHEVHGACWEIVGRLAGR